MQCLHVLPTSAFPPSSCAVYSGASVRCCSFNALVCLHEREAWVSEVLSNHALLHSLLFSVAPNFPFPAPSKLLQAGSITAACATCTDVIVLCCAGTGNEAEWGDEATWGGLPPHLLHGLPYRLCSLCFYLGLA